MWVYVEKWSSLGDRNCDVWEFVKLIGGEGYSGCEIVCDEKWGCLWEAVVFEYKRD